MSEEQLAWLTLTYEQILNHFALWRGGRTMSLSAYYLYIHTNVEKT